MSSAEGQTPRTDPLAAMIARIPPTLAAGEADDLNVVVQLRSTGQDAATWTISVKDRTCTVEQGETATPNVTLVASADTWAALVNQKLQPTWAVMSGALRIQGDFALALRLQSLLRF